MTELKNSKIYQVIEYIKDAIKDTRFEGHLYVVGGCVRDILMGVEPKDLDIVCDIEHGSIGFATWLACKTGCYKNGSNPVIFNKYGTAKVRITSNELFKDIDIECVTTRKEQYHNDSRNPQTSFGTIEEDAQRRDLTINALYLNISTGEIIDVNGNAFDDIENHIIRTPSDPNIIFKEDPLRQLRVIRFSTRFNWGIESKTWLGIVCNAYRMNIISQERITDEINKILLCQNPSKGIRALYNCGLLGYVLPEVKNLVGCSQGYQHFGDVFEHTMMVLDNTKPILEYRLAALFHDIGKPMARSEYDGKIHFTSHEDIGANITKTIMQRMKYPTELTNKVYSVVKNHMRFKQFNDETVPSNKLLRRFASNLGENLNMALDIIHADNISHKTIWNLPNQIPLIRQKYEELAKKGEKTTKIILPVNGRDIMDALQIKSSPNIGRFLNIVKEAYLDNPSITKEECLKLVKSTVLSAD